MRRWQQGSGLLDILLTISAVVFCTSVLVISVAHFRAKSRDQQRAQDARNVLSYLQEIMTVEKKVPCHALQLSPNAAGFTGDSNFMEFLVTKGYRPHILKDPGSFAYEYETYKNRVRGSCGQIAYFGYYVERSSECIPEGVLVNDIHLQKSPIRHCHIFFPKSLPPPCKEPLNDNGQGCIELQDSASENDYLP